MYDIIKKKLLKSGWYVKRLEGVPVGTDLGLFLRRHHTFTNDVCLDVGAHRGETIAWMLEIFNGPIHAFEPVKVNFEACKSRYEKHSRVTLQNLGLSNKTGEAEIFIEENTQTNSLKSTNSSAESLKETISLTTIDSYLSNHGIQTIEMLKVDAEGHEMEILEGAKDTLSRQGVKLIFCETTLDMNNLYHTPLNALQACLYDYGYKFKGVFDQVFIPEHNNFMYCDALFALE